MRYRLPALFSVLLLIYMFFATVLGALPQKKESSCSYQNKNRQKIIIQLENKIPQLMEKAMIPGLSIAVIRDGEIFWRQDFGVRDTETDTPVNTETIFEAASLSKSVFSYAVMKMVERRELELDKPLAEYASEEFIEKNFLGRKIDDPRFRKITTRMVLSHSCGFPNWRRNNPLEINFEPGEKYSYSGEGFGYLQKIVEHLSGLPLNKFMEKEVFIPLDMRLSSYTWQEKFDQLTCRPHSRVMAAGKKRKPKNAHAAATLHTTVMDYATFLSAMLSQTGLKASTTHDIFSPQVIVSPEANDTISWGLGFGLQQTTGGTSFWQWGDNGNFKAFYLANLQQKTAVVYFTNSRNGLTIRKQIIDLTIGGNNPVLDCEILADYGDIDSPWMEISRIMLSESVDAAFAKIEEFKLKQSVKEILPEGPMNEMGYYFLNKKKYAEAIKIFQLNVQNYPDSWNVYDSLGEAYLANGEYEASRINYQKSLQLNPENNGAREVLKDLAQEKK